MIRNYKSKIHTTNELVTELELEAADTNKSDHLRKLAGRQAKSYRDDITELQ